MKNTNGKNLASWWSKTKDRMSKDKEAPDLEQNEATAETAAAADNMAADSNAAADENKEAAGLEKLRAENEELNKKFLYLMSEFENYKRRTSKERMELFKTASKDLVIELLPVLDDFERGLQVMETAQDMASVKTGVDLVYTKFRQIMVNRGLSPIDATGAEFDPELHEAISQAPAGPEAVNKVVQEVEKGYRLNDTVVRYAKVIVGV
jgi:molecular chaperone GrpE